MKLDQILPPRLRTLPQEFAKVIMRLLPQRFHRIGDEIAKFGTIGLINLVVNFAVFNLLWFTFLRNGEVKAKIVATIVATTCAYFMNRHWTYRDRPKSTLRREYSLFFFFNAVGLIIEAAVLSLAKYGFGQTNIVVLNLCSAVGIVLGTIFRFWAYRTHVFKIDPITDAAIDAEPAILSVAVVLADSPDPAPVDLPAKPAEPAGVDSSLGPDGVAPPQRTTDDEILHDELTQLELDTFVTPTSTHT